MSQQGPGGYGGGGPNGPPGGGGGGYGGPPPGGYPPGGYGPPGGQPPGGFGTPPGYGPPGAPPPGGYAPPQYGGYPGGPPQPVAPGKKSPLIWIGVGCGVLLLLGIAASIASYLYVRQKASTAIEQQIQVAESGVALGASAIAPSGVAASGTCAKTVACCQAVAAKSGSNADLAVKACAAYANLSDAVCAQQYPALKRAATTMGGSCE